MSAPVFFKECPFAPDGDSDQKTIEKIVTDDHQWLLHNERKKPSPSPERARWMVDFMENPIVKIDDWLVVWTSLKNISQLGWLFPIYGKIKNVPNHQPDDDWGTHGYPGTFRVSLDQVARPQRNTPRT